MCGIIGISLFHELNLRKLVISGIAYLQKNHCGTDSCGVAWWQNGVIKLTKTVGVASKLAPKLKYKDLTSNTAICHTRLATTGVVAYRNAHPFLNEDRRIALVGNGVTSIVRNFKLRHWVRGETDTESLMHYIEEEVDFSKSHEEIADALHKADENHSFSHNLLILYDGVLLVVKFGHYRLYMKENPQSGIIVSTESWSKGWKRLDRGDVIFIKGGKVIYKKHFESPYRYGRGYYEGYYNYYYPWRFYNRGFSSTSTSPPTRSRSNKSKLPKTVGWFNEKENLTICTQCATKYRISLKGWEAIRKSDKGKMHLCSKCNKTFFRGVLQRFFKDPKRKLGSFYPCSDREPCDDCSYFENCHGKNYDPEKDVDNLCTDCAHKEYCEYTTAVVCKNYKRGDHPMKEYFHCTSYQHCEECSYYNHCLKGYMQYLASENLVEADENGEVLCDRCANTEDCLQYKKGGAIYTKCSGFISKKRKKKVDNGDGKSYPNNLRKFTKSLCDKCIGRHICRIRSKHVTACSSFIDEDDVDSLCEICVFNFNCPTSSSGVKECDDYMPDDYYFDDPEIIEEDEDEV
mgnify:CR=1 FL=1